VRKAAWLKKCSAGRLSILDMKLENLTDRPQNASFLQLKIASIPYRLIRTNSNALIQLRIVIISAHVII
jgi:hypothetical protein